MSPDATQAIEQILADADVPDSAGLRIEAAATLQSSNGAESEGGGLRIVIAPEAAGGDEVVEQEGARVFIEPTVSAFLEDKLLDVAAADDGIAFTLAERP